MTGGMKYRIEYDPVFGWSIMCALVHTPDHWFPVTEDGGLVNKVKKYPTAEAAAKDITEMEEEAKKLRREILGVG